MSTCNIETGEYFIPNVLLPTIFFMSGNVTVSLVCRRWRNCCNEQYSRLLFDYLQVGEKIPTRGSERKRDIMRRFFFELNDRVKVIDSTFYTLEISIIRDLWERFDARDRVTFIQTMDHSPTDRVCENSQDFQTALLLKRFPGIRVQRPGISRIPFEVFSFSWWHLSLTAYTLGGCIGIDDEVLTSLEIKGTRVRRVDVKAPSLELLDLQANRIRRFSFPKAVNLESAILCGNLLQEVAFKDCFYPRLRYLNLAGNQIPFIRIRASQFPGLKVLILSNNRLKMPPITDHEMLEELHLQVNEITFMTKVRFPRLRVLDLSENRIRRFSGHLPRISFLNLTGNPVKRVIRR